jgi:hypothetical protein
MEVVMVVWEYMSEACSYVMLIQVLNMRGDRGWELIDIHREPGRVEMLFKRRRMSPFPEPATPPHKDG